MAKLLVDTHTAFMFLGNINTITDENMLLIEVSIEQGAKDVCLLHYKMQYVEPVGYFPKMGNDLQNVITSINKERTKYEVY